MSEGVQFVEKGGEEDEIESQESEEGESCNNRFTRMLVLSPRRMKGGTQQDRNTRSPQSSATYFQASKTKSKKTTFDDHRRDHSRRDHIQGIIDVSLETRETDPSL